MRRTDDDKRGQQIAVGVAILVAFTLAVCGTLIGWGHLPGLLGEWVGMMVGVMTTPFLLEASLVIIGLSVVLAINYWRRRRAGNDWVYLEQVTGPDVPDGLPGNATWAVYRHAPLEGEVPSWQAMAEGALEIGDQALAVECLAAMSEEELKRPETLALRLALAQATGKQDLVESLANELRTATHGDSRSPGRNSELEKSP